MHSIFVQVLFLMIIFFTWIFVILMSFRHLDFHFAASLEMIFMTEPACFLRLMASTETDGSSTFTHLQNIWLTCDILHTTLYHCVSAAWTEALWCRVDCFVLLLSTSAVCVDCSVLLLCWGGIYISSPCALQTWTSLSSLVFVAVCTCISTTLGNLRCVHWNYSVWWDLCLSNSSTHSCRLHLARLSNLAVIPLRM